MKHFFYYAAATLFVAIFSAGAPISFKKHVISHVFVSEGVAVGDLNNDGQTDILAGPWWYEAPTWTRHLLHADTTDAIRGYSTTFLNYCIDVNNDGWQDLIRFDQPGAACTWYENPQTTGKPWRQHIILKTAGNETPLFVDVDGDGRNDIICNDTEARQVVWLKSPSGKGNTQWQHYVISTDSLRGTHRYTHGLGWGDLNKDGRKDVIIKSGWWECPADVTRSNWTFHAANLGQDCANMVVLDANRDGEADIISSSAHNYGIWWHEQRNGQWTTHEISKQFSQTHALALEDLDGDGHQDIITGKRYYAHNGKDPGAHEPAMLYWFAFKPGKTPTWTAHEIDNNSGVGNNFVVQDMNKDGLKDIVVSNKKGVFFFEQVKR
ncbi:FG-GAP repeat domain-containing protein [Chitinophaga alhagiae]|uniref:FG-GAP repeat domain-containing protein n=1 Tax=Chitinophaga alhagiae TaxID=2203219 RepID=UPI000E5A9C21|nr:VCBS repeat-containing protein [Chitinophaga alhagiae]